MLLMQQTFDQPRFHISSSKTENTYSVQSEDSMDATSPLATLQSSQTDFSHLES